MSDLFQKLKQYRMPDQFYIGASTYKLSIPYNVLLFNRQQGRQSGLRNSNIHHRYVLIINLMGNGDAIINGTRYEFTPGNCILIYPHTHHKLLYYHKDICWQYITFEADDFSSFDLIKNKPVSFPDKALDYLTEIAEKYTLETFSDYFEVCRVICLLLLILNEVLKEQDALLNKGKVIDFSKNSSCITDKINRYLYNNLAKNVSIDEIADTFNYSPTHIRRLYKDFMGISIGKYLKEMRMARAKKLLFQSNMKISDIASKCGYESVYSFSNAFKNVFGISPKNFKNK